MSERTKHPPQPWKADWAQMRQEIQHLRRTKADLLEALKYARKCIAYCRANHPDVQRGDGIPAEAFIDAAIAKAEGADR